MNSQDDRMEQVELLQNNLEAIRKIAGWTTEELGIKIGVTKQTISNLENKKTTMTVTQYIAIRTILDYEIQTNKENVVLAKVVDILLNQNKKYTNDEKNELIGKVSAIAATAAGGITGAALISASSALLGSPIIGGIAASASLWLPQLLKFTKKKK